MNFFVRTSTLVLVLCLTACSLPTANQGAQQVYRLQPIQAEAADIGTAQVPLLVIHLLPMGAAPGLGSAAMLYSEGTSRPTGEGAQSPVSPGAALMPYRDSRWLAPPAQLIGSAIAQTLSRQPWVSAVETNEPLAPAAWTLHCALGRLEHDISGDQGVVRLDLTCQLIRNDSRGIVAHWRFDAWQPVAKNDARHFAAAAQSLLDRALGDIVHRVHAQARSSEVH